jgi:uncharacterized protein (DUF488 family)
MDTHEADERAIREIEAKARNAASEILICRRRFPKSESKSDWR